MKYMRLWVYIRLWMILIRKSHELLSFGRAFNGLEVWLNIFDIQVCVFVYALFRLRCLDLRLP